ncbi:MAG: DNA alkylation repair protein [Proteobacteria bacterium]|nr:DNA alkylation repair protein [Pseudomonadota bacterium]
MTYEDLMNRLREQGDPLAAAGMARYGIRGGEVLGVTIPFLASLASGAGRDDALAERLWLSKVHEARVLAVMVADPGNPDLVRMDRWVRDFDSWDICDQAMNRLFRHHPRAREKALEYAAREPLFVKRAGFVLMAQLAVHDKKAPDRVFLGFLQAVEEHGADERPLVKKAVSWAVRQAGKRSPALNRAARETARRLGGSGLPGARWIASDAIRELSSPAVQKRLERAAMKGTGPFRPSSRGGASD